MTNLQQQIKEALDKATPGPWKYQKGFYGNNHLVYEIETDILICTAKTHAKTEDSMQLIANAPTWLQQLLDELDRQHDEFYNEVRIGHQELEKAQKEIERLQKESNENYQFGQTHMRRADRLSLELTAARNNYNWANTRIEELEATSGIGTEVLSVQFIDEVERHAKTVASNIRLSGEAARLREALEFYASFWNHDVQLEDEGITSMQRDKGSIARKALSTLSQQR